MAAKLHVIAAGAAQSVVQQVAERMRVEQGVEIVARFGAVGAQKQLLLEGAEAGVIILTAAMIDELIEAGVVAPGSRMDLGQVVGGIAVRRGTPVPDVSTPAALRASLLAAVAIYVPDPAIATAGQQFVTMCETLAILDEVRPKLKLFPNGFTAMTRMGRSDAAGEIGCTQITEIKLVGGVDLVAPLPAGLQKPTTYALGFVARGANREIAQAFAASIAGPASRAMRIAAGFMVD